MDKVKVIYHNQTNTYWVSDVNWKKRWDTEIISMGTIEINISNVEELTKEMKLLGYIQEQANNIPFSKLGKITEDMINKDYKINVIQFED